MSISLLLYFFTVAQVDGRYSCSTDVELPQPIATLSLISIDCYIFGNSLTQVDCQIFSGIAPRPVPFPNLLLVSG